MRNGNRICTYRAMCVTLLLQDGWTALMLASQKGHTETVKCLIDTNASVDIREEVFYYCVFISYIISIYL